jgi:guanylate kinase
MKKRIILCGPGASGKDYFRDWLVGRGVPSGISTTTRDPRPGETDGVTYHFTDKETFMSKAASGEMIEWCEFSGWLYGTAAEDFNEKRLFIMTPSGMAQIDNAALEESIIVYFNAPRDIRLERLEKRFQKHPSGDTPEGRLDTDDRNFSGFQRYDIEITDPYYDPMEVLNRILELEPYGIDAEVVIQKEKNKIDGD